MTDSSRAAPRTSRDAAATPSIDSWRGLMISASGVRGIVGEALTPDVIVRFAGAHGTLLGPGPVVVGRDSRPSGAWVSRGRRGGPARHRPRRDRRRDRAHAHDPVRDRTSRRGGRHHHHREPQSGAVERAQALRPGRHSCRPPSPRRSRGAPARERRRWVEARSGRRSSGRRRCDPAPPRRDPRPPGTRICERIASRRFKVAVDCVNGAGSEATPALLRALGLRRGADLLHARRTVPARAGAAARESRRARRSRAARPAPTSGSRTIPTPTGSRSSTSAASRSARSGRSRSRWTGRSRRSRARWSSTRRPRWRSSAIAERYGAPVLAHARRRGARRAGAARARRRDRRRGQRRRDLSRAPRDRDGLLAAAIALDWLAADDAPLERPGRRAPAGRHGEAKARSQARGSGRSLETLAPRVPGRRAQCAGRRKVRLGRWMGAGPSPRGRSRSSGSSPKP